MALLNSQMVVITGLAASYGAVAASDTVTPGPHKVAHYKNASGSPVTVTVITPGTTWGQANPDVAVSVPATTGERFIGPLVAALADTTTGLITITTSAQTSVTAAILEI